MRQMRGTGKRREPVYRPSIAEGSSLPASASLQLRARRVWLSRGRCTRHEAGQTAVVRCSVAAGKPCEPVGDFTVP